MSQEGIRLPTEEEIERLRAIDPELADRLVQKIAQETQALRTPPYVDGLFYWQKKFFEDPAKKKAAVCSRRAGKSESIAAWLLDGGKDDPGGLSVYVATSRALCRLILWRALTDLDRRYQLGLTFREEDNQLNVVLPNDHRIWLAGCKDSAEINKFRGPYYRRVAIDEAQSYGDYIKDLIEDVFEPALLDLNGELILTGTPAPIPAGYFYEVTTGRGVGQSAAAKWSTHHWTMVENPHIQLNEVRDEEQRADEVKRADRPGYKNHRSIAYLHEKLESNGWDRDHPTFRREWLGEWVRDADALVYPYDPKKNAFRTLPHDEEDRWYYYLGIDVGFQDSTAFVVGAMRRRHPEIYIVHSEAKRGLIPSAVAARIEGLQRRFGLSGVVMDTGGIGKGYAEECSQRYGLAIEPAEKTKKRAFVEIVAGELLSGNIKVHTRDASSLIQEWQNLMWDEKREKPDDRRCDDHESDAALYLVRSIITTYRPQVIRKPLTEAERLGKLVTDHREKMSRLQQRRNKRGSRGLMKKIARGTPMW